MICTDFPPESEMTKTDFDRQKPEDFKDGPFIESQPLCGGGYRDVMYMPDLRAYGWLKDGRYVWAWVRGSMVKRNEKEPA